MITYAPKPIGSGFNDSPMTKFYRRTFSRATDLHKNEARTKLVDLYKNTAIDCGVTSHRFLTLPGPWWHFERQMGEVMSKAHQNPPIFTGCERDASIFLLSSAQMATKWGNASGGMKSFYDKQTASDVVATANGTHTLHNENVFARIARRATHKRFFSMLWLDLCSPITEELFDGLSNIPARTAPNYCMLSITVMVGREVPEVTGLIQRAGSREALLHQEVLARCGSGFGLTDERSYVDSSVRMLQMTFVRTDESDAMDDDFPACTATNYHYANGSCPDPQLPAEPSPWPSPGMPPRSPLEGK